MAVQLTDQQKKVIETRGKNLLVSAAAGSGKTYVLVKRIIRMITEGDDPLDIDRLLVVTFTRAAAQQMREKIADAVSERLKDEPENAHLRKQETLLYNAQITTIDGFCASLFRNNFSDIGMDPACRQMDDMESKLLETDTVKSLLEECYGENRQEFLDCVEFFCYRLDDSPMEKLILDLYRRAQSHPWPMAWLEERLGDYTGTAEGGDCTEQLLSSTWFAEMLDGLEERIREYGALMKGLSERCAEPGGPAKYADTFAAEADNILAPLAVLRGDAAISDAEKNRQRFEALRSASAAEFGRLPSVRKTEETDPDLREAMKEARESVKTALTRLRHDYLETKPENAAELMRKAAGPVQELVRLAMRFTELYAEEKRDRNVLDFSDLEHFALQILARRKEDGTVEATKTCEQYRAWFREILIDEYQDCNDVQEYLFSLLSGESEGVHDRFMVGDVKQSIYRFRMARPEIFMEKYASYREDDPAFERIDLDRNFRSRSEVLKAANEVFRRIMRPEIGKVDYDEKASLKPGASYPETDGMGAELLIVNMPGKAGKGSGQEKDSGQENGGPEDEQQELNSRQAEIRAVASRIRELISTGRVTDGRSGQLRPVKYSDIVILLRSASGWESDFRNIFETEGIPLYVAAKAGYFDTEEIRQVLNFLTVLDNPRQDIPLYGTMRGYFGGFSEDTLALIRGGAGRECSFYEAVLAASKAGEFSAECGAFLAMIDRWRDRLSTRSIRELLCELLEETGYEEHLRCLPAGEQRAANLRMLLVIAGNYEKTSYSGLFQFLRYLEEMRAAEQDVGEASTIDESADVVRIMTIHKSKGLEFPICFVSGMGRKFNTRDTSGPVLCDNDRGLGVDYCDPKERVSETTLRKRAVADGIRRDTLGEELRVLYVAMTRAKEKLIMTAAVSDAEKLMYRMRIRTECTLDGLNGLPEQSLRGQNGKTAVPCGMLLNSGSFLSLVLGAVSVMQSENRALPFEVKLLRREDLEIGTAEEETRMAIRRAALLTAAERAAAGEKLPDPELAERLEERFSRRYPHEELRGLYTKTTVTELKRARLSALPDEDSLEEKRQNGVMMYPQSPSSAEEEPGTGATHTDVEETAPGAGKAPAEAGKSDPLLPRFISEGKDAESGKTGRLTGAARGTAIHRCMQLLDFERFPEPGKATAADLRTWLDEMRDRGILTGAEAEAAGMNRLLTFLKTGSAARMAEAFRRGMLYREQPFVMGVDADRLGSAFPKTETVLVQGIIDVFFIEEGGICILDYKTDSHVTEEILRERYSVQLDYYAEALSRTYGLPVREKLIYSFFLGKEVEIR